MVPETRYTKLGDFRIAYQVVGKGPKDLLWVGAWNSHVDAQWELPNQAAHLLRLASFSRLILFDRRGAGASDPLPVGTALTWEEWMDDMRAVLDAVGSQRSVVAGVMDGGPLAVLFAATHPSRSEALILVNSGARILWADDYPFGMRPDALAAMLESIEESWGSGAFRELAPSLANDQEFWRAYDRFQRLAASRHAAVAQLRLAATSDVRPFLSAISVPTLVVHRENPAAIIPLESGRYLSDHIPGARLVIAPGRDLSQASPEMSSVIDAIEEFLTGRMPTPDVDRVLATVVFTDLVGSTQHAARLGDRRWRELLATHDTLVRRELLRFRGREVKQMGDGFLATFDGPGRAVRCASAIRDAARSLGIDVRAGAHAGEIELQGDDVGGIAVHIAQRVMAEAQPGEIVVSSTVRDLVAGSGIAFEDRGLRELRGVPEPWRLFLASV